jgi:hypothetical protein
VFTTLIVASLFVAQSTPPAKPHRPVDEKYVPKVGDIAGLGIWQRDAPTKTIERAFCFSTLQSTRQFYANMSEEADDGVLSNEPDAYMPKAGTGLVIVAIEVMKFERDGNEQKAALLKVRLLEGEFKDRELYTAWHNVFRYADSKPGKRAATRKPASEGSK